MKRTFRTTTFIGVVATALVATALGTVGAPAVASASAPAATSISIRPLQPSVTPGGTGVVVGNLQVEGASPADRPVALEAQATGEQVFTPIGTATTGEKGGVRLTVAPEVTTRYRWHYAGADDARARFSGVVVIRVHAPSQSAHRLPTTLSVRALRPIVGADGTGVVRGTLRAKSTLRSKYVVLLSRTSPSSSWQYRNGQRSGRDGEVSFRVRPETRTTYRLAFAGTGSFRPVRSGTVEIRVRQVVSITATPEQVDPGAGSAVSGIVTYSGSPVAGVPVDLQARGTAPKDAWSVVGTATTAADGSVGFPVTPAAATRYRLKARPVAGLPAGVSPVVEVGVRAPSSLSVRGRNISEGYAISGQLRAQGHPVRGEVVKLQRYDAEADVWAFVGQARTDRDGKVQFVQRVAAGSVYRLVYIGKRFAASTSATLTD